MRVEIGKSEMAFQGTPNWVLLCVIATALLLYSIITSTSHQSSLEVLSLQNCSDPVLRPGQISAIPTRLELVVELIGGLGNQLWIYNSVYGIAKRTGRTPYICSSLPYKDIFPKMSFQVHNISDCRRERARLGAYWLTELNAVYYDRSIITSLRSYKTHAYLCCYLQNIDYFHDYIDELKTELEIHPRYRAIANKLLLEMISGEDTHLEQNRTTLPLGNNKRPIKMCSDLKDYVYVGVHIRRGTMDARDDLRTPDKAYFRKAMDTFRVRLRSCVRFIIVTEDQKWSRSNIPAAQDVFFAPPRPFMEHFTLLTICNHTIMSFGTFGYWAGWLARGTVVYFADWMRSNSSMAPFFRPDQWYPMWWQGIKQ